MLQVLSIVNAGAGNYTVTFNEAVTPSAPFAPETNLLLYSAYSGGWLPLLWITSTASTVQTVQDANADTDCTELVILGPLVNATSADPPQQAMPQTPVT
jgi:hypothetical protein